MISLQELYGKDVQFLLTSNKGIAVAFIGKLVVNDAENNLILCNGPMYLIWPLDKLKITKFKVYEEPVFLVSGEVEVYYEESVPSN